MGKAGTIVSCDCEHVRLKCGTVVLRTRDYRNHLHLVVACLQPECVGTIEIGILAHELLVNLCVSAASRLYIHIVISGTTNGVPLDGG